MSVDIFNNIILLADQYKSSHHYQYPPGTQTVYSYFESRGGKFPYTVFFGLQYIIKKYLTGKVITEEKIKEAKEIIEPQTLGHPIFNEKGWYYILKEHNGCLPVRIKAIPEGTIVPVKNVLFTVENTDPTLPWLTNYLETLLVQAWYPCTVATISRIQKQVIHKYMTETCDSLDTLEMKLHDAGFRGVSSVESAALGGASHLVNFKATDTVIAHILLKDYYYQSPSPLYNTAVLASEHSTVTSWGREGELDSMRHLLEKFPEACLVFVCDSYDLFLCCEQYIGKDLHDIIVKRAEKNGAVAIRPDSGDPVVIVMKVLEMLEKSFGSTINTKGFKVLPRFMRVVQDDGINYIMLYQILEVMKKNGWAAENITFGSGGALLQKLNRDTLKFAYKCSYATIKGEGVNVFKDPITDRSKKSKKGKLTLQYDGCYSTKEEGTGCSEKDLLKTVFENGVLMQDYTFSDIRKRADVSANDWAIFESLDLNTSY